MLARRDNVAILMRREPAAKVVRRADVNVAVTEFGEIDGPQGAASYILVKRIRGRAATVSLRSLESFGRHPSPQCKTT